MTHRQLPCLYDKSGTHQSPDTLIQLVSAICKSTTSKHKFTLHEWQRLTGWINWSLNIFPLLRPALNNFYAKISGKSTPNKFVRINNSVWADLEWAAHHLKCDSGVRLIHQIYWDMDSADIAIFCDACLEGMGFWLPDCNHSNDYYSSHTVSYIGCTG